MVNIPRSSGNLSRFFVLFSKGVVVVVFFCMCFWQNLYDLFGGFICSFCLLFSFSTSDSQEIENVSFTFILKFSVLHKKWREKYLQLMKGNFSFTHWRNWKSNPLRDSLNSYKIYAKLSDTPFHNCSSSWTHSVLLRSQLILYNLQILSTFSLWVDPLISVPLLLCHFSAFTHLLIKLHSSHQ